MINAWAFLNLLGARARAAPQSLRLCLHLKGHTVNRFIKIKFLTLFNVTEELIKANKHRRQSWGIGGRDLPEFGMGKVVGLWGLHEILLYPIMYTVQKYEMKTLSEVLTSHK